MSILTSSSSSSVSRGYEYYRSDMVKSVKQLNDFEYEAYVDGSEEKPYYVKIDVKHPKKSHCDCPHANGHRICKHMVALYFTIFESEVSDCEDWMSSDYHDEYDEDEYEDEDDYRYANDYGFEKPLFFDEVLENYVDSLSIEKLRSILKSEFHNNEERTYDLYLKSDYKKYMNNDSNAFEFLSYIKKKVANLNPYHDYDYLDYTQEILSTKEINKIKTLYSNLALRKQIDSILFVSELAIFDDYQHILSFYKECKTKTELNSFREQLNSYFNSLKHYGIRNNTPKANVAIVIYLLSDFTLKELAETLIKNAKYDEYIEYVIENYSNVSGLYREFINLIEKNFMRNKEYIPDVIGRFISAMEFEKKPYHDYFLYSFLCNEDVDCLTYLEKYIEKKKLIKTISDKTEKVSLLAKLYVHFNMTEELWVLLATDENKHLLEYYVVPLKDIYQDELFHYFAAHFYAILETDKKREVYQKAVRYIKPILSLNNGDQLVDKIVMELKTSSYHKCIALFDEIEKAMR